MFGVDDVLLATLATQVGSAVFNSYRGNKHSKELAAKQQALEEKIQKDGMQNAREEFAALCSLQREIEHEMQRDRIDMIKSNHANALLEKAYSVALDKWPLLVPPYVIKNECLLNLEQSQRDILSLNCIMTTSMDSNFNRSIFPNVEEAVAEFCYAYWNVASERSIRFYQRAWKDNITDIGAECRNIHALMKDVPTLVLSPQVRHEKLTFRFFWWGLSTNPQDVHIDDNSVFDPELSNPVYEGMKYSDDDIRIILSELIPKLESFISYFADLYYWNYYRSSPILPSLIHDTNLMLPESNIRDFASAYIEVFNSPAPTTTEGSSYVQYANAIAPLISTDKYEYFVTSLLHELARCFGINEQCVTIFDLLKNNGGYWHLDETHQKYLKDIVLSDKMIVLNEKNDALDNNQNTIDMNALNYVEYKNQLVKFADAALDISDIPQSDREKIEENKNKVETDQFSMALIGEYQGGKSTTFDVLCGGRDISPRGNNMKTSACRISATNVPDNLKEYAEVTWKSDRQLLQTIKDVLKYIDPEDLGCNIVSGKEFSYEKHVRLGDKQHIGLIKDAISQAQNDNPDEAMKDVIIIAQFVAEFYGSTVALRKKTKGYTLEEVLPIMVFPRNMYERIFKGNNTLCEFSKEESLFAFVETVDCYIHSEELRRLGCSVVDCPGLFASDYDTSIALLTIAKSDAVLYLLSGEKQMGQGDNNAISKIYKDKIDNNPQYDGKDVFFAINQRKSDEETSFVGYNLSKINSIGFKKKELPLFNALLCYYAKIGHNYLSGTLDKQTEVKFMASGRGKGLPFEKKWITEANSILNSLWLDEQYKVTQLDQKNCDTLLRVSNFQGVFSPIEDYVVQNKAYTILVDSGANKILEALLHAEKALLDKKRNLLRTVEERQAAYEHARQVLATFVQEATDLIDNEFISEDTVKTYVCDIYSRIFQNNDTVRSIAFKATKELVSYIKRTGTKWNALLSKVGTKKSKKEHEEKLGKAIKNIVENAFNEALTPPMESYVVNVLSGKEQHFNRIYDEAVCKLQKELKRKWDIATTDAPLLNSIPTISVYGDIKDNVQKSFSAGLNVDGKTVGYTASAAISQISKDIVDSIVSLVVGVIVAMMYDFLFFGGAGQLLMLIYGALSSLFTWAVRRGNKTIESVEDFNKDGKNIYNLISSNVYQCVNDDMTKEKICFSSGGLGTAPKKVIDATKENCRMQLNPVKELLEEEIRKREREFAAARSHLEQEAARIKEVVDGKIVPLRANVLSFIKKITKYADK